MSMTQIAFIRKAEMPTNKQIQDFIKHLGYNFSILDDLENRIGGDGLNCAINGSETYFEVYLDESIEITDQEDWIRDDLTNQDTAISFVWGADYAAGACIGLISLALIDLGKALVYYMDDQMRYTREMLLADTPQFLEELKKESDSIQSTTEPSNLGSKTRPAKSFWARLIGRFK